MNDFKITACKILGVPGGNGCLPAFGYGSNHQIDSIGIIPFSFTLCRNFAVAISCFLIKRKNPSAKGLGNKSGKAHG